MVIEPNGCAICDRPLTDGVNRQNRHAPDGLDGLLIECPLCGRYELIGQDVVIGRSQWTSELKLPLSCAARQASESGHPLGITKANVAEFAGPHTKSRIADNRERLLREVARKAGRPQMGASFSLTTDFTLIDCYSTEEFVWYIESFEKPTTRVSNWCRPDRSSTNTLRRRLEASSTAPAAGRNTRPLLRGYVVR